MPDLQHSPEVTALLEDGIRYERGGVTARARSCFEEAAARWRENPVAAAEAWWRLGNLHRLQSHWSEALEAARSGASLAREHGLSNIEADALNIEGAVWMTRGDYGTARALFERTLELATTCGTRAKALQNLGGIHAEAREFEVGERLFTESREEYRTAGDLRGEAISLLNIGRLQHERGDHDLARETLQVAVDAARQTGDMELAAATLLNLGIALGALEQWEGAEERITTAYGQFTIADIPVQRVRCLMELAELAVRRDDAATARICLAHARDVSSAQQLPRELRLVVERIAELDRGEEATGE